MLAHPTPTAHPRRARGPRRTGARGAPRDGSGGDAAHSDGDAPQPSSSSSAYYDPTTTDDGAVRIIGWRTPKHTLLGLTKIGMAKCVLPWHRSFVLGVWGGLCVTLGGTVAIVAAAGLHGPGATTWVGADRLVVGATFPIALLLIVFMGLELFTGNTLYATLALLARRGTVRDAATNLFWSYVGNLVGTIFTAYLFAYETDLLTGEPFASYTRYIAVAKVTPHWGRLVLRAIPANVLVCAAVWFGLSADEVAGKVMGMWLCIFTFAVCGFEHCVADMFFVPIGMMNGADVSVGTFITHSLLPVTAGNMIGAAGFVGLFFFCVFEPHMTRQLAQLHLKYAPDHAPQSRAHAQALVRAHDQHEAKQAQQSQLPQSQSHANAYGPANGTVEAATLAPAASAGAGAGAAAAASLSSMVSPADVDIDIDASLAELARYEPPRSAAAASTSPASVGVTIHVANDSGNSNNNSGPPLLSVQPDASRV